MRKFKNSIGCTAEFDEGLSEEVINERLNRLGDNWEEVEEW